MFFVLSIFEEFSYYKLETYLPDITNISRVEILEAQYFLDLIYRIMISYQHYERSLHSPVSCWWEGFVESMGLMRCVKQSYGGITRSLPSNQKLIKPALTKNTALL